MANMDVSQVTVGSAAVTGAIKVAPRSTTLPTDATTALPVAFKLLGFTSEAGVKIAESRETNEIPAWEGRTTVCTIVTKYTEAVSFMPIQCNEDVAKLIWGEDAVTVDSQTGAMAVKHHGASLEPVAIVIETVPAPGIVKRYVGVFQLWERGEVTMDGTQVDGRQLTFNAVADNDNTTMTEYTAFTD